MRFAERLLDRCLVLIQNKRWYLFNNLLVNAMSNAPLPILYSYRRCPYAMRARMALFAAEIPVEIREISLRNKPAHLLQVSPKGTVPVLVISDKQVIEQSLDIMDWALQQHDPNGWLNVSAKARQHWITMNDGPFKKTLDQYKYPDRHPEYPQQHYRALGEGYLQQWEQQLSQHRYLTGDQASIVDVALFPFVRQFAAVDADWFATSQYVHLRTWLANWVESALFARIMQKYPTYQDSAEWKKAHKRLFIKHHWSIDEV